MYKSLLSICIPTYKFGKFIGQTLDSILPQLTPDVEVIVFDGGSNDNTPEIISQIRRQFPELRYVRQEFRGGIDRDIEKVVEFAQGKYCWLFSADDVILPGAIDEVLSALESDDDIYLCEHDLYTNEMKFIKDYPIFNNMLQGRLFNLANESERKEYFRLAKTSEAFFSFLAGPIFKKAVWDDANIPDSFYGTHWIVAGHLLWAFPSGLTINYMGEKLLHKREGNDSFSDGDVVNLYRIFIESFQHVAGFILGSDSAEMIDVRRVLQSDITFLRLLSARGRLSDDPRKLNIHDLDRLAGMLYVDKNFLNAMKYACYKLTPQFFVKSAYRFYKKFFKKDLSRT